MTNKIFNVSEFNIELSEDFNITQITGGTVLDGAFNVDYNENVVFASSNETSLISGLAC